MNIGLGRVVETLPASHSQVPDAFAPCRVSAAAVSTLGNPQPEIRDPESGLRVDS